MRRVLLPVVLAVVILSATAVRGQAPASEPPAPRAAGDRALEALGNKYRPLTEDLAAGQVDWTHGEILAIGVSKARGTTASDVEMAKRAASLIAARNAVLLMGGIRLDADRRTPGLREGQIGVDAVLRDYREVSCDFDPKTGEARSVLAVPIYGARGVVAISGRTIRVPVKQWAWSESKPAGRLAERPADAVIIDARGTKFAPSVFPRIAARSGETVFSALDVPKAELSQRPMVVYAELCPPPGKPPGAKAESEMLKQEEPSSPSATEPATRPAPASLPSLPKTAEYENPLVLHAAETTGKTDGVIVLRDEDMKTLADHPEAQDLMKSGKIVIVAEPQK